MYIQFRDEILVKNALGLLFSHTSGVTRCYPRNCAAWQSSATLLDKITLPEFYTFSRITSPGFVKAAQCGATKDNAIFQFQACLENQQTTLRLEKNGNLVLTSQRALSISCAMSISFCLFLQRQNIEIYSTLQNAMLTNVMFCRVKTGNEY